MGWLPLLIATLSTFALGALWYGPLFAKAWGKASGIDMQKKHGHPAKVFGFSEYKLFEAPPEAKVAPKVDFTK